MVEKQVSNVRVSVSNVKQFSYDTENVSSSEQLTINVVNITPIMYRAILFFSIRITYF